jgi:hypothetical protein
MSSKKGWLVAYFIDILLFGLNYKDFNKKSYASWVIILKRDLKG